MKITFALNDISDPKQAQNVNLTNKFSDTLDYFS